VVHEILKFSVEFRAFKGSKMDVLCNHLRSKVEQLEKDPVLSCLGGLGIPRMTSNR
jgi:hypothetical protein